MLTKDIIIINNTDEDLSDIYFKFTGLEKKPFKISPIKKNSQKLVRLFIQHILKPDNLIFIYTENGIQKETIVYDRLLGIDLRGLTLIIEKKDDIITLSTKITSDRAESDYLKIYYKNCT